MNEDEEILQGLDLLGDWLDAKGYTEEAGLCTRAMDKINLLKAIASKAIREQIPLGDEIKSLRAENEKLRAALKPFALSEHKIERWFGMDIPDSYSVVSQWVTVGDLRAASDTLKDTQ